MGHRWPPGYRLFHWTFLGATLLLALTGVALYAPSLRTPLIPYLPLLHHVHIWLGLLWGGAALGALFLPGLRRLRAWDWIWPLFLGGLLLLSGLLLWMGPTLPAPYKVQAFYIHGGATLVYLAWVLYHSLKRLFR
ncbi:MAG: hypothetical protein QJR00_01095, partial [Bacillota bacterium]|nr:hypothetical protein [Bacillota bacterium]